MMTSSWRHFMLLELENPKFCKIEYRLYHPSKFHISWLSGSNFMEVSVSHHFVENYIGYQLSKFQCSMMSGANFIEGVESPYPSATMGYKSPVLIG